MTFPAHGMVGAASMVVLGMLAEHATTSRRETVVHSRKLFWWLAAVGFFLGTVPDTIDFILATIGVTDRWWVYGMFHVGRLGMYLSLVFPPILLHLLLDRPIHVVEGYDWWGDYWWLEISCWLVSGAVLWWTHRKTNSA